MNKPFDFHAFPNGLRLITIPLADSKSVTVLVMVATGSRYETPKINGISHFLEHMMFKGTTKRPGPMDISRELDSIGAEYNAFTSKEYTGYYVKCSTEKIDTALDVISDIFQNSKFDEKEIETEKGVISEEINMYYDTPSRYIGDIFESMLYKDQPLGYETQGTKEVIRQFKRDDFAKYFHSHYFDKNTVIAIAGNITTDEAKKKIEKYFADIRDNDKPLSFIKTTEKQDKPELHAHFKQTDQTHFILGFRAFNYFDNDRHALGVMNLILSGGMSSRLWEEFRDKRGLAYYVRSSPDLYADVGYFGIAAGVDNARFPLALEVALEQCKKLATELVSEEELKKVKDYAHGKTAIGLESSDDFASYYADQELLRREMKTPEEYLAIIDKITSDDIQRVAEEIFKSGKLNLAWIGQAKVDDIEINKIIKKW
ncbi:MAG: pitrilysin family protein [Minisyncoccia bacterium]